MKKQIFSSIALILIGGTLNAQLYSSGNNVIAGSNVGIGTNSPACKLHIKQNLSGSVEHLRMENTNANGTGKFIMYNDVANNYATFTKYGSTYAGGYGGISAQYPYANLLAFGNNGGGFLLANSGNVGIGLYNAGSTSLKFNANYTTGYLGLGGNSTPAADIHFNSAKTGDTLKITNSTTGHLKTDGMEIRMNGNAAEIFNRENSTLTLGTNNTKAVSILANGSVSIGNTTTPSGYKLYVETGILTEKIKVAIKSGANWADYVFDENYELQPLHEVETFIKTHKHLPGVPSANEVVENGIDVATMNAKLLEKIEELTLHMINLEKRVDDLSKENSELKSNLSK
ncbi:MAG TPA: hypothetical protein PKA54_07255 [Chitinophagaceae bacterium]|nr:MAG: hypothetical protein UZ11_BCD004002019 [Bacteroidetes bacterium OLB11]HMN33154.1 hypothetical protein [Chitinophagaceae bacterium]